ncbi:carbon-nitrogen hydrolase family protein [Erysipelotrichaceae bacterium OttesenSCG-928-M19]|nr:carbon-nitrogen hydrolase family protein [Erysipelotrichaceae bacterium OttesenSCG-928-M19]
MLYEEKKIKVAVIQAAPILFDKTKTVAKAISLVKKAADQGAKLIVFPEAFIPCYPRGMDFGFAVGSRTEEGREDWLRLTENSIVADGRDSKLLGEIAKECGVYVSIGVNEKEEKTGTIYCSNFIYSDTGELVSRHRKLKPTGLERCIWGEGDGSTLDSFTTPYGIISSLICWENYMPLARANMYEEGVSLYLAPTADSRDTWQHTIKHIAIEGRCFVLSCNQYVTKSMYPLDLKTYSDIEKYPEVMSRGGSAIIDPFGNYVVGPIYDKEAILIAELNLDMVSASRFDFDASGHYSRKDVFDFKVKK